MGKVSNPVILESLLKYFNIQNYVETGVGNGTSMQEVFDLNVVKKFYGIELDKAMCERLINTNFYSMLTLYNGYSKDQMIPLLNSLDNKSTLFWLDAHFPDADYNGAPYDAEKDVEKRIPLQIELELICSQRNISEDVIMIDDLRIYIDGPFHDGSWPLRHSAGADGYNFVRHLLEKTHILIENYKDQGYLLAFPKDTSADVISYLVNH
jgi:hypothetical protein